MGIMGFNTLETTLQVPGVKLVGVCDLYSGRLERPKEIYGKDMFTRSNYLRNRHHFFEAAPPLLKPS